MAARAVVDHAEAMRWRRRRRDEDDPPSYFSDELTADEIEALKQDFERRSQVEGAALGAAVRAVRANRRGKSTAQVTDELESQLAASGRSLPRSELAYLAREIAEPHWRLRHPIEHVREIRASRRRGGEDPFGDFGDSFGFDEAGGENGFSDLLHQVREQGDVRRARFAPDDPEVIEVVLLPWSESTARHLRDFCSPHEVRFVDGLPHWQEWDDRWP